jgi:uncharacterized protein (DUF2147 family)
LFLLDRSASQRVFALPLLRLLVADRSGSIRNCLMIFDRGPARMVNWTGIFAWLALFLVLLVPAELRAQAPIAATPVGHWRTFDDRTGLERGLVAIEERAGILTGPIVGILNVSEAKRICEACKDGRKDQPILGMTIITGMGSDGDGWDGGKILDPQTGSIYRCSMRLEDGGAKLIVRGYVGVSLFGRSQTWLRQPG